MEYTILIADDDAELVRMLKTFFELRTYRVITARNGTEALKMAEQAPDLILLDINMPGADGLEVCRRIRDKVSCPILFLTARVEEQDRAVKSVEEHREILEAIRNKDAGRAEALADRHIRKAMENLRNKQEEESEWQKSK